MTRAVLLGTRRSALARTQAAGVARALAERTGATVELVDVVTRGDVSSASLSTIGGTGVFATALREALLDGRVDLAVHSLKDLPTAPAPGLEIAAVPVREDPRDVLVAAHGARLADLPAGARIGTGSPRRAAQLRRLRPDLVVQDVRGNIDTRLRLVADGHLDAVVLARAGLVRIGREGEASEVFAPDALLPAPGQGALAVECRADDAETLAACRSLDDAATRGAVAAERSLLAALEAGCTAPVGALATWTGGLLELSALVSSPDGDDELRRTGSSRPTDAAGCADLGREVAAALLAAGAARLTGAPSSPSGPLSPGQLDTRQLDPDPLHASAPPRPPHPPAPSPKPHDSAAAAPLERAHP